MAISRDYDRELFRWRPMLGLSLLMHGVLFSLLFWVPGNGTNIGLKMNEAVYEVDLVEMPRASQPEAKTSAVKKTAATPSPQESTQAKRIYSPSRQKNTVIVAKRIVEKSRAKPKKAELSSNQLLDKAISKIQKKVKAGKNTDYLDKAIAAIDKKVGSSGEEAGGNSGVEGSLAIRMYQMQVETWIKSHWSYPDALGNQKNLEAVVLVKVKADGTVVETDFVKPSRNNIFDESVLKAIEKAKPLPPLPEGYDKSYEEIKINFNLKDLE